MLQRTDLEKKVFSSFPPVVVKRTKLQIILPLAVWKITSIKWLLVCVDRCGSSGHRILITIV